MKRYQVVRTEQWTGRTSVIWEGADPSQYRGALGCMQPEEHDWSDGAPAEQYITLSLIEVNHEN